MRKKKKKNNGDGTFSEIGQLVGVSNTDWSWAALFCDFDGDANKDLFVSNGFVKDFSDLDFINFSTDKLVKASKGERNGSLTDVINKMPTAIDPLLKSNTTALLNPIKNSIKPNLLSFLRHEAKSLA